MSLGLVDKWASLSATNKGAKSLLAIVSLEYVEKIITKREYHAYGSLRLFRTDPKS